MTKLVLRFIGGEWHEISDVENSPVFNPSRGEIDRGRFRLCTKQHVDAAVECGGRRRFRPGGTRRRWSARVYSFATGN